MKKSKKKKVANFLAKPDLKIAKTVQASIPYKTIYEDYDLIESEDKVFTRQYEFNDINFSAAKLEDQEIIYNDYSKLLNMFPSDVGVSLTAINKTIKEEEYKEEVLLKMQDDKFDEIRKEQNKILLNTMSHGKNNLQRTKYLTVSIPAETAREAYQAFLKLDSNLQSSFDRISKNTKLRVVSIHERLEVLHDLYNPGDIGAFDPANNLKVEPRTGKKDRKVISSSTANQNSYFENLRLLGISTKDIIGPASMEFNKLNHFKLGEKFGRVLFLKDYPNTLTTDFLTEMTDLELEMALTVSFQSYTKADALKKITQESTNISAEIVTAQKEAAKKGYDSRLIDPKSQQAYEDVRDLMLEMSSNDQNLFKTTFHIVIYGDSVEDLDMATKTIENTASRSNVNIKTLLAQQEQGFNTVLPLGLTQTSLERVLKTDSLAVMIPFDTQELNHRDGNYYGENAISGSMIRYNRRSGQNFNGFILGMSGSGKSFSAKNEITQQRLVHPDDVFIIIDPENEYGPLARYFDGSVIDIQNGIGTTLNPFHMDFAYSDDEQGREKDPRAAKSLMIQSFVEQIHAPIQGGYGGLNANEKGVIDVIVRELYVPYLPYLNSFRVGGENYGKLQDMDKSPTLNDFYNALTRHQDVAAQRMAASINMYVNGSIDLFSGHTNVDLSNNFIVFNTQQTETNIRSLVMQQILDLAWSTVLENARKGVNTWIYIDEIYLLFKTPAQTEYVRDLFKRGRKYGASITGISQNIDEIIRNEEARLMVANSTFLLLFNQTKTDQNELSSILNMSETQLSYITSASPGHGLLYDGSNIVPFRNLVPLKTKLYSLLTSTMTDRVENERLAELLEREEKAAILEKEVVDEVEGMEDADLDEVLRATLEYHEGEE